MTRLLRTELLKHRTTPTLLAGVALAPAAAGLVALAVLGGAGRQGNDPLGPDSLVGAIGGASSVVTLLALFVGLLAMAGEYRHQTITTTFLATPRRRDVVLAKVAASALTGAAAGLLAVAVAAAVAVPWLLSHGVDISVDAEVLGVAAGLIGSSALHGALGVSVGALVRNQTAAVTTVLVWLLAVEGVLTNLFAGADIGAWLPGAAGRALVPGSPGDPLAVPLAVAVFTAYVGAFALAAVRLTLDRDVT